jgi:homoserine O-acetyltransferase
MVMPGRQDLFFPPEESEYEANLLSNALFRPIESIWGHGAGAGVNSVDTRFIDESLKELLSQ